MADAAPKLRVHIVRASNAYKGVPEHSVCFSESKALREKEPSSDSTEDLDAVPSPRDWRLKSLESKSSSVYLDAPSSFSMALEETGIPEHEPVVSRQRPPEQPAPVARPVSLRVINNQATLWLKSLRITTSPMMEYVDWESLDPMALAKADRRAAADQAYTRETLDHMQVARIKSVWRRKQLRKLSAAAEVFGPRQSQTDMIEVAQYSNYQAAALPQSRDLGGSDAANMRSFVVGGAAAGGAKNPRWRGGEFSSGAKGEETKEKSSKLGSIAARMKGMFGLMSKQDADERVNKKLHPLFQKQVSQRANGGLYTV